MKRRIVHIAVVALISLVMYGCAGVGNGGGYSSEMAAQAHFGRAMALKDAGNAEQAAEQLQSALNSDPDMYHAYYQLGLIYKDNNKPEVARQVWTTGIQRASVGPERSDYPRVRAVAEMRAAIAGLDSVAAAEQVMEQQQAKQVMAEEAVVAKQLSAKQSGGKYAVLFSSNLKKASADGDVRLLKSKGWEATIKTVKLRGKTWHRVWAACCTNKAEALKNKAKISKATGRRGLEVMIP